MTKKAHLSRETATFLADASPDLFTTVVRKIAHAMDVDSLREILASGLVTESSDDALRFAFLPLVKNAVSRANPEAIQMAEEWLDVVCKQRQAALDRYLFDICQLAPQEDVVDDVRSLIFLGADYEATPKERSRMTSLGHALSKRNHEAAKEMVSHAVNANPTRVPIARKLALNGIEAVDIFAYLNDIGLDASGDEVPTSILAAVAGVVDFSTPAWRASASRAFMAAIDADLLGKTHFRRFATYMLYITRNMVSQEAVRHFWNGVIQVPSDSSSLYLATPLAMAETTVEMTEDGVDNSGMISLLKKIAEYGIDINVVNDVSDYDDYNPAEGEGEHPFEMAILHGSLDYVKTMVELGADMKIAKRFLKKTKCADYDRARAVRVFLASAIARDAIEGVINPARKRKAA